MADSKRLVERYHKLAYNYLSEALKLDEQCDSLEKKMRSLKLYKSGVEELKKGLSLPGGSQNNGDDADVSKSDRLREKMRVNLQMAEDRIRDIEKQISDTVSKSPAKIGPSGVPRSRTVPRIGKSTPTIPKTTPQTADTPSRSLNAVKKLKGIDSKLSNVILDQILESRPSISFTDVAGLQAAKQALSEAVILPTLKPELFTGLRSPVQGILLFGPPGNGKTMLARAVAGESKCTFFNISASALTSKWVGEAEKLVKALFVLARDLQPVIIFIDEVDSILCERTDKENEASRRLKTEFLLQFDGVSSSPEDRILIIGATNRPQDLDDAILRRFPKRIYVGLPDLCARKELLEKLLSKHSSPLSKRDLEYVARRTENFSNFDLTQLAKEAAMGPLREILPEDLINVNAHELRPILSHDFDAALSKVRPSSKREHVENLLKFNQEFGGS